ncbi:hypothetical protein PF004_g30164 [Phytophthora fragariae]|uniref:Uncharacterized protein n=1 Tax=Phytophthora fragariae TaxID=53985 RepID=A0A6G0MDF5_9STRA|nr:hypothetical protein PF004_g30164 [Phytophthora fragariae]
MVLSARNVRNADVASPKSIPNGHAKRLILASLAKV